MFLLRQSRTHRGLSPEGTHSGVTHSLPETYREGRVRPLWDVGRRGRLKDSFTRFKRQRVLLGERVGSPQS